MEILQTRDTIVQKLTSTHGENLEITANITDVSQIDAVMEGLVSKLIGDDVGVCEYETLLRMTDSWYARCRDDLTGVGKTPDVGFKKVDAE